MSSSKDSANEPMPIWPEAPRLCPQRKFPPYRFTPGLNAHPRQNPKGHAYGKKDEKPTYELYLFGIDLYHQGYLWESHEAWESLWHLTGKEDAEGQFLQGLIQNAAALLKVHLQQWDGARHLSREAHRRLLFVSHSGKERMMGIIVKDLVAALEAHYAPLWKGRDEVFGKAPRLEPA